MIIITVAQKGLRLDAIKKIVENTIKKQFPKAHVNVTKKEPAKSRADRFAEIMAQVEDAKSNLEDLKAEMEEWRDNYPENLQGTDKFDQISQVCDELDSIVSSLDEASGYDPEFPGMY